MKIKTLLLTVCVAGAVTAAAQSPTMSDLEKNISKSATKTAPAKKKATPKKNVAAEEAPQTAPVKPRNIKESRNKAASRTRNDARRTGEYDSVVAPAAEEAPATEEAPVESLDMMGLTIRGESPAPKQTVAEKKDEKPVNMAMVEQKPSFPGGDAGMMKWLSSNVNYPAEAAKAGVSGKVTVQFVVEKDGSISNVNVVRGKHPALDAEALRVVKNMPNWTPGRNGGVPVRVTYMVPINFRLQQ